VDRDGRTSDRTQPLECGSHQRHADGSGRVPVHRNDDRRKWSEHDELVLNHHGGTGNDHDHAQPKFHAIAVHGSAVPGRTETLVITGVGFYGKPRVTSNEGGTTVVVTHDRGTQLVVRVKARAGSKKGWHTFTIRLANGQTSRVNYLVK